MIDTASEKTIWLTELPSILPTGGDGMKIHFSTVLRWVLHGTRGVRLEAQRIGGRWLTSHEAVQRFMDRLTPNLDNPPATPRSAAARQRATDRAARQLEAIGI